MVACQPMASAAWRAPSLGTELLSAACPAEMMTIVLFLAAGRGVAFTLVLVPLYPALVAAIAAFKAAEELPGDVELVFFGVELGLVLELHAVSESPSTTTTAAVRINAPLWVMSTPPLFPCLFSPAAGSAGETTTP